LLKTVARTVAVRKATLDDPRKELKSRREHVVLPVIAELGFGLIGLISHTLILSFLVTGGDRRFDRSTEAGDGRRCLSSVAG
jgi:hypothetical protein